MHYILDWLKAKLEDTQMVILFVSLITVALLFYLLGDILAPALVAVGLTYVLDGMVISLEKVKVPRLLGIAAVSLMSLLLILFVLLLFIPLLSEQLTRLLSDLPRYVGELRDVLVRLQQNYAEWLNPDYVQQMISNAAVYIQGLGGRLLSYSISSIPNIITLLVYAILVPVLVFFLLKDKHKILGWMQQFLPRERNLILMVWGDVDAQLGNYIRGKVWESAIVGVVTGVAFAMLGMKYTLLLAVITGLSVWIPFVGAAVVTIPVTLLAFFQWGFTSDTLYPILAYAVIQALDGNVLVPVLFSEVVNLHPIAIIVAVLIFGGLWGVVGVFFAIPLAAMIQSILFHLKNGQHQGAVPE